MKLILGLGNPEQRYNNTRHNIGYAMVDAFVQKYSGTYSEKSKFKALVCELTINGEKVIVAKPLTYYNRVGESYRALSDFYRIDASDVLVVADDLALELGTVRTRQGGSDAGNNGIKSINTYGGEQTKRIRIGIAGKYHETMQDAEFVLSKLTASEQTAIKALYPIVIGSMESFVADDFQLSTYN